MMMSVSIQQRQPLPPLDGISVITWHHESSQITMYDVHYSALLTGAIMAVVGHVPHNSSLLLRKPLTHIKPA